MKSKYTKKINEAYVRPKNRRGDPAAEGSRAARQDAMAQKDKNRPFNYYAEEFYALEEIRQGLMDLAYSYKDAGGMNFKKAAILVEKAQIEMLKAGR